MGGSRPRKLANACTVGADRDGSDLNGGANLHLAIALPGKSTGAGVAFQQSDLATTSNFRGGTVHREMSRERHMVNRGNHGAEGLLPPKHVSDVAAVWLRLRLFVI